MGVHYHDGPPVALHEVRRKALGPQVEGEMQVLSPAGRPGIDGPDFPAPCVHFHRFFPGGSPKDLFVLPFDAVFSYLVPGGVVSFAELPEFILADFSDVARDVRSEASRRVCPPPDGEGEKLPGEFRIGHQVGHLGEGDVPHEPHNSVRSP
jgi:hypothetical protein